MAPVLVAFVRASTEAPLLRLRFVGLEMSYGFEGCSGHVTLVNPLAECGGVKSLAKRGCERTPGETSFGGQHLMDQALGRGLPPC